MNSFKHFRIKAFQEFLESNSPLISSTIPISFHAALLAPPLVVIPNQKSKELLDAAIDCTVVRICWGVPIGLTTGMLSVTLPPKPAPGLSGLSTTHGPISWIFVLSPASVVAASVRTANPQHQFCTFSCAASNSRRNCKSYRQHDETVRFLLFASTLAIVVLFPK